MALKLSNNADGLLAMAISDSATSLTLRAGHGSRFPVLGPGDWFPITVVRASDPSQLEIMRCIGRSGDTLTVVRAQEGTAAITFDAGDVVSLRLTAGTLEENFVRRSDLGTAATRDVTTDRLDTTAGRVLKVGDFGIGPGIYIDQGRNLNEFTTPGEYFQTTNANAIPELNYPAQYAGSLKVMRATVDGCVQEYTTYGNNRRKFLRGLYNGVWSSWVEFYNTGNVAQLISDANLVQTSRTISTGTGLTGGGDLSANRTISLASSHWPIGVGQTWQDVTGSRSSGTTYTNTTGRTIVVSIDPVSGGESYAAIYVDGKLIFYLRVVSNSGALQSSAVAIVPPGSTYRVSAGDEYGPGVSRWMELR